MRTILKLPSDRVDLDAKVHGRIDRERYAIEKVTFASEPGSRITANLYLPLPLEGKRPAIVLACGHGGSKSSPYAQYAGKLYSSTAKTAVLVIDTIGEEERNEHREMGTRAHDRKFQMVEAAGGRSVMGKMVWDLMRAIDYLESRPEVDPERIGFLGYSMGGCNAGAVAVLDERVRVAVIAGWWFLELYAIYGKNCSRVPYAEFMKIMRDSEMTGLLAPHCAALFFNGDADRVIDPGDGRAALGLAMVNLDGARRYIVRTDDPRPITARITPGGHRPYFLHVDAVRWVVENMYEKGRPAIPTETVKFGDWVRANSLKYEKLYGTEENEFGLVAVQAGIKYDPPETLACLPPGKTPEEYTLAGWIDFLRENQ